MVSRNLHAVTRRRRKGVRKWLARLRPVLHAAIHVWKLYRRGTPRIQVISGAATLFLLWLGINWVFQVIRKPTELFFPVSGTLFKSPVETWAAYGPLFKAHSTAIVTPDLLAALAQVEGAGNPVARTYWRWELTSQPFEIYKPASSAVGMFQITDGTFEIARKLCIHDHVVVEDGPWYAWRSCWFNSLYSRVLPSHAVEMTSANLDREVTRILSATGMNGVPLAQKQTLAAIVHLCGSAAGEAYSKRKMRLLPRQLCGEHSAADYVARVTLLRATFSRLSKSD